MCNTHTNRSIVTEEIVELSATVNASTAAPNLKRMWNPKRLSVVQMITEKAAKYMLQDGLVQVDMNMMGKVSVYVHGGVCGGCL